ncbi:glycerol-3-phosphate 1-O-acyltransferase PlsY [Erysipelothrix sp. HDW6C]|uniref:glycerol-3-phosphate 1-O-acyltransferase PlsY n=1 Tax=Erysipelothrix sp. HDW6C TaxID=2714930 RepID=UPI00140D320C|nr:glycerol-3-phosphate 1-O-acyltransferase PlsY [Erysipelothrix sp. HDW6C]QIK70132.1 glycerol-3-phosphate 1-O-acyltransferase PlsY [Erysipelothrix sp. HDW6C]
MNYILASVIGYLLGSIPFALVIGKVFYKVDIREHGSGNLGGTNAGRTLGKEAGIAVTVFDVLKAAIAMMITMTFSYDAMIYAGFFATIGHCFPIFAKFKGGKAVSTAFGFLLSVSIFITKNPLLHFVLPLAIFFASLYLTKLVSLSSMIAVTFAAIVLALTQNDMRVTLAMAIIAMIVIVRHRANIGRIRRGEERKITWM